MNPKLSDRLLGLRPTAVNRVLTEASQLQAAGRDLVSLMRGQPDFPTPMPIVERLASETAKVIHSPDIHKRLSDIGLTPVGDTPAQFAATVRSDFDKWGKAIRAANIKLD